MVKLVPQPQEWAQSEKALSPDGFRFDCPYPEVIAYIKGFGAPEGNMPVTFRTDAAFQEEEYRLSVTEGGITVTSRGNVGAFRAMSTLKQLIYELPLFVQEIHDFPSLPNRGIMLDISRGRLPTLKTLLSLVDLLADLKYNQLQLYMDAPIFEYAHFRDICKDAMTVEEFVTLEKACRDRFINLVPNQNGFGHLEKWKDVPAFEPHMIHADGKATAVINPLDPDAIQTIDLLYRDLLPYCSSPYVHIGCDETAALGKGETEAICREKGTTRVFLDHLNRLIAFIKEKYHKTPMFWDDILTDDLSLLEKIPDDVILMDWQYFIGESFTERCRIFQRLGKRFYTCPSASTFGHMYVGYFDQALLNIEAAADGAYTYGGEGLLLTDWCDGAKPAFLPISFLPYAYAAACSWNYSIVNYYGECRHVSRFGGETSVIRNISYGRFSPDWKMGGIVPACEEFLDRFVFKTPGLARCIHLLGITRALECTYSNRGDEIVSDVQRLLAGKDRILDSLTIRLVRDHLSTIKGELETLSPSDYRDEVLIDCRIMLLLTDFLLHHAQKAEETSVLLQEIAELKKEYVRLWNIECHKTGSDVFCGFLDTLSDHLKEKSKS